MASVSTSHSAPLKAFRSKLMSAEGAHANEESSGGTDIGAEGGAKAETFHRARPGGA